MTWSWSPLQFSWAFRWCNAPSGRHIGGPHIGIAPGWVRHQSWIWFSSPNPFSFVCVHSTNTELPFKLYSVYVSEYVLLQKKKKKGQKGQCLATLLHNIFSSNYWKQYSQLKQNTDLLFFLVFKMIWAHLITDICSQGQEWTSRLICCGWTDVKH